VALDNRSEVRKVLLITLLLNLFVMGLKAVVGFWTVSLSLQADALHSVTDSANNVLGLIASRSFELGFTSNHRLTSLTRLVLSNKIPSAG